MISLKLTPQKDTETLMTEPCLALDYYNAITEVRSQEEADAINRQWDDRVSKSFTSNRLITTLFNDGSVAVADDKGDGMFDVTLFHPEAVSPTLLALVTKGPKINSIDALIEALSGTLK